LVSNGAYPAAIFTPDNNITVTRMQLQLPTVSPCSPAYVLLTDGMPTGLVLLPVSATSAASDTSPTAVNFAAGAPIYMFVIGSCPGKGPTFGNVTVQYKVR
jgi:hypothetical protein